jgi:hypothetical protein
MNTRTLTVSKPSWSLKPANYIISKIDGAKYQAGTATIGSVTEIGSPCLHEVELLSIN